MFASCSNPTPKSETASYIDSVSRSVKQERLIEFAKNENASLELNMTRLRKATIEYQDFVKSNDKFIINNFRVLDVLRVSDDKISLTITKARTKGLTFYLECDTDDLSKLIPDGDPIKKNISISNKTLIIHLNSINSSMEAYGYLIKVIDL